MKESIKATLTSTIVNIINTDLAPGEEEYILTQKDKEDFHVLIDLAEQDGMLSEEEIPELIEWILTVLAKK